MPSPAQQTLRQKFAARFGATRAPAQSTAMATRQETAPAVPAQRPSGTRAGITHRPSGSLVPQTRTKADNLGSVVSQTLPTAATIGIAKLGDLSSIGKAVKAATGFDMSDILTVGAGLVRATNLDASMPTVRKAVTQLVSGKLIVWADKAPEVLGGHLKQWLVDHPGEQPPAQQQTTQAPADKAAPQAPPAP